MKKYLCLFLLLLLSLGALSACGGDAGKGDTADTGKDAGAADKDNNIDHDGSTESGGSTNGGSTNGGADGGSVTLSLGRQYIFCDGSDFALCATQDGAGRISSLSLFVEATENPSDPYPARVLRLTYGADGAVTDAAFREAESYREERVAVDPSTARAWAEELSMGVEITYGADGKPETLLWQNGFYEEMDLLVALDTHGRPVKAQAYDGSEEMTLTVSYGENANLETVIYFGGEKYATYLSHLNGFGYPTEASYVVEGEMRTKWRWSYDTVGNCILVEETENGELGDGKGYEYDSAGHVTGVNTIRYAEDGSVSSVRADVTYTYDAAGRRNSERRVRFAQAEDNTAVEVIDLREYVYDAEDRLIKIVNSAREYRTDDGSFCGGVVRTSEYDTKGNTLRHTSEILGADGGTAAKSVTEYTYDAQGNRTGGTLTEYDSEGNVLYTESF